MDPAVSTAPVAAGNEAAAEAEAIALVSGQVTMAVAGVSPSPQTAQALVEVVIGMVGAGVSVHPQCMVEMVVVIVVSPCSHASQTSIQTATSQLLDNGLRHKRSNSLDMTIEML
jgi:hypothetical protein